MTLSERWAMRSGSTFCQAQAFPKSQEKFVVLELSILGVEKDGFVGILDDGPITMRSFLKVTPG